MKSPTGILARIVEQKRGELREVAPDVEALETRARERVSGRRDFQSALRGDRLRVIAEAKRASPSKGLLAEQYDPASIAVAYEQGGAAAISVLTDRNFFQGSLEHLSLARAAAMLPVLRKDFTVDERHVLEAAAAGADAILLIAAILTRDEMRAFRELASRYAMASLVEVHDEAELEDAVASGASIIGVNSRNLNTFEVNLDSSLRLARSIPPGLVRVAESGIHGRADALRIRQAGFDAVLVGEHLMKSPDPSAAVAELIV
jgi:indole-3-glycerol phosphate synthase